MKRKTTLLYSSSLEFLLDTICNAFGSIMFIALLVIVMAQFVSTTEGGNKIDSKSGELKAIRVNMQILSLLEELDKLTQIEKEQAGLILLLGGKPDEVKMKDISEQEKQNELIQIQIQLKEAEITKENDPGRANRILQTKIKIEELLAKLGALKDTKKEVLKAPKWQQSAKTPFWTLIKNKKLYLIYRVDKMGSVKNFRDLLNSDYITWQETQNNSITIEPIPIKGEVIDNGLENGAVFSAIKNDLSKEKYSLQFAVFADSFNEFLYLKKLFVEQGFDYNWEPFNEGDPLILSVGRPGVQGK